MAGNTTEIVFRARDETRQAIESVKNGLSSLESKAVTLGPLFAAVGAAFSVGAIKASIDNTIKFAAALDDMAETTGASVENLSALAGVAKISGEDLGNVESGLVKLAKALHRTDEESKGAGKALSAIGLSIDDLKTQDTAEAMLNVAKALSKFEDGSGKTAVAVALLGKNGAALLPFLKDLAEKSELVGKVTTEQAAMAEQYEKNLVKLSSSLGVTGKVIAMELLPFLTKMSEEMLAAKDSTGNFATMISSGVRTALETVGVLGANVMYVFKAVGTEIGGIAAQVALLFKGDFKGAGAIGKLMKEDAAIARKEVDDLSARILDRSKATNDAVSNIAKPKVDFTATPTPKSRNPGSNKADEAAALIARLNEQIAVKEVDLLTTDKMTAAEKEAVKVMVQLRDGTLKATEAQKQTIATRLQSLLVIDKEVASQQTFRKAVDDQTASMENERNATLKVIEVAKRSAEFYGMTEVQISAVIQARLEDAIAIAQQNGAAEDQISYLKKELELRKNLTDALDEVDTRRVMSGTKSGKYAQQHREIDALRQKMLAGKISETEYDEAVNSLVGKTSEALDTMDEFTKSAAKNMESAMAEFFINPTKNGIQGIGAGFTQTLQKMIAEASSAQLMRLLVGNLGQASGGQSGNWGWVGQAASWIGSFFADGGIMTQNGPLPLRKYATGGIASSPQMAIFGEGRTPEAYVPLPDGRRIPVAMQGGQGGQGSGHVINVHVNSQTGDRAEIRRSAAAGARAALGIINGAQRYG